MMHSEYDNDSQLMKNYQPKTVIQEEPQRTLSGVPIQTLLSDPEQSV